MANSGEDELAGEMAVGREALEEPAEDSDSKVDSRTDVAGDT